jgi:drug/metabolite transporter (DMT)-like permease
LRLAVAMTILGTVGAFTTEAGQNAVTSVFWRCVFGAAFLLVWTLLRGELRAGLAVVRRTPAQCWRIVIVSLCQIASWVAFFASFGLTTIATTTIVYHVYPFLILGIGAVLRREWIPMAQAGWTALAFVGLVFASGVGVDIGNTAHIGGAAHAELLGIGLTLIAALAYAVGITAARGLTVPPTFTTLCQSSIGVIVLAPFAALLHPVSLEQAGWLVGLGVIHTGIAYTLSYSAYPKLPAAAVSGIAFLYPLVAIVIDWACYHHPLSPAAFLGLGLISIATVGSRLGWTIRWPLRWRGRSA